MTKSKTFMLSVQIEAELAGKMDRRIKELGKTCQETDRSKWIRGLIRRELQTPNPAHPSQP